VGGKLERYTLAPYGKYPKTGRSYIGRMQTRPLEDFWTALASASGLNIQLLKLRGVNSHHIVESSFKAFSRAFRNLLDRTSTLLEKNNKAWNQQEVLWGPESTNHKASLELKPEGRVERKTKEETTIVVHL